VVSASAYRAGRARWRRPQGVVASDEPSRALDAKGAPDNYALAFAPVCMMRFHVAAVFVTHAPRQSAGVSTVWCH